MTSPRSGSTRRTGGRGAIVAVTPATVFSAASGYLVLLLAAGALGADRYELFAVYWGGFFAVAGVLGGFSNETTRSVHARVRGGRRDGATPFVISWGVGVTAAALTALTSPLWAERLIPGHERVGTLLLSLALVSLVPQMALMGALAGLQRWRLFAVGIFLDAAVRVGVAAVAVALTTPEVAFLVATVAGAFIWPILVAFSNEARSALRVRGDVATGQFCRRAAKAMSAGAAVAVVMVGFPVLLKLTAPEADPRTLSTLVLAVTLTRAPLLVPLTAFQNALVVHYVQHRRDLAALARTLALVLAVTLVATWLAVLVGPTIISWMGEGFLVDGAVLGGLMLGSGALAMALLTGYAALAHDLHTTYALGWWLAAAVVVLVLLTPFGLEARVVAALVVGPVAGASYHVGGIILTNRA